MVMEVLGITKGRALKDGIIMRIFCRIFLFFGSLQALGPRAVAPFSRTNAPPSPERNRPHITHVGGTPEVRGNIVVCVIVKKNDYTILKTIPTQKSGFHFQQLQVLITSKTRLFCQSTTFNGTYE